LIVCVSWKCGDQMRARRKKEEGVKSPLQGKENGSAKEKKTVSPSRYERGISGWWEKERERVKKKKEQTGESKRMVGSGKLGMEGEQVAEKDQEERGWKGE
jgi:hypothetical protein